MKKKVLAGIMIAVVLAILFVPMPIGPCKDGGTRQYSALTYKIVAWHRLHDDGIYKATKVYWFPNNFKSVDIYLFDLSEEGFAFVWCPSAFAVLLF